MDLVFRLGIFRRAPRPSDIRGRPCALFLPCPLKKYLKKKKKKKKKILIYNLLVIYDTSSIREPPKVS
jgi:hypothetical protein